MAVQSRNNAINRVKCTEAARSSPEIFYTPTKLFVSN